MEFALLTPQQQIGQSQAQLRVRANLNRKEPMGKARNVVTFFAACALPWRKFLLKVHYESSRRNDLQAL
jgi:hypothetical protein